MKLAKILLIFGFIFTALVAGCGGRDSNLPPQVRSFSLELEKNSPNENILKHGIVKVYMFNVEPQFDTKKFIIRTKDNQYQSQYYNEFSVEPSLMMSSQTQAWLENSGIFKAVVPSNSVLKSDYLIEGDIQKLFADFRDSDNKFAEIEIGLYLIDVTSRNNTLVFKKIYDSRIPLASSSAEDLLNAYKMALRAILKDFQADLIEVFKAE